MPPKNVDLTAPDGLPSPGSTSMGSPRRHVIVEGASVDVIAAALVSSPDMPATDSIQRVSGRRAGVSSSSKGRKLTRAERWRAFLDGVHLSGRKKAGSKGTVPFVGGRRFVDLPPAVVADLVARGQIARRPASKKDSDPTHASARGPIEASGDQAPSALVKSVIPTGRSAVSDFRAEADRLSLPLGTAPNDEIALERLKVVAADASDIFPNVDSAIDFLTARPLDGRGRNGIAILREKGLPGILSSLDQRRFGYSG